MEYNQCLNSHKKLLPSTACCPKMKEQQPCYYRYMQDDDDNKLVFIRIKLQ
ncbi:hypothetical protein Godav_014432, partial [Gossypium davidsonii]|nr:hypothetical protein [Gossypium davidsonii]